MRCYINFFWCTILLLTSSITVFAQTIDLKEKTPQWTKKLPVASNSTFTYEIVSATGSSISQADENSMKELVSKAGLLDGVIVKYDNVTKTNTSQKIVNGKFNEVIDSESESIASVKSNDVKLYIKEIDHHYKMLDNGTYLVTKLYAKSSTYDAPLFDNVEVTSMYGGHGLWRSAIVPGWGQFYKGSKLKGGLILGGTAACVVGAILTENNRVGYLEKINQTHDVNLIRQYSAKATNMQTARNVCWGAAAAVYIYNLIDAIVAPGAKRVVVKPRVGVAPVVSSDMSGLALSYNF